MKCLQCGACCESITLQVIMPTDDLQRFVELRTKPIVVNGVVNRNFDCRCTMLTPEQTCAIYATRPKICRDFEPGGGECLATARARRTEAQFEAIRDPEDPHWDGRPGDLVMTAEAFAKLLTAVPAPEPAAPSEGP